MSLDPGFSTASSRRIFGAANRLQCMLEVESALARATAGVGLIPHSAAEAIAAGCFADAFNAREILAQGWEVGSPVIPLVAALKARMGEEQAQYVHFGATTQDIVDTGLMLQVREGLTVLDHDLRRLGASLAAMAAEHRHTPSLARTLMQPAAPTTFGFKVVGWLDPLSRSLDRLAGVRGRLALQFGGAVGDLAAFGEHGPAVADAMGLDLGLEVPALPWHTARDRVSEIASALALHVQAVAKTARDLLLLAQGEVAEISMRSGGSSAMPNKRNPIDAIRATAASRFAAGQAALLLGASPQEHQRAAGSWQLEWAAVPMLFHGCLAATEALARAIDSVEVNSQRMAAHLDQLPAGRAPAPSSRLDEMIDRALAAWQCSLRVAK